VSRQDEDAGAWGIAIPASGPDPSTPGNTRRIVKGRLDYRIGKSCNSGIGGRHNLVVVVVGHDTRIGVYKRSANTEGDYVLLSEIYRHHSTRASVHIPVPHNFLYTNRLSCTAIHQILTWSHFP
jgi:hypothetical protein